MPQQSRIRTNNSRFHPAQTQSHLAQALPSKDQHAGEQDRWNRSKYANCNLIAELVSQATYYESPHKAKLSEGEHHTQYAAPHFLGDRELEHDQCAYMPRLPGNAEPELDCQDVFEREREGIHQDVYAILMDRFESEEEVEKRLTPIDLALNNDSLGLDSAIHKHLAETVLRTAPGAMPSLCKCGLPLLSY